MTSKAEVDRVHLVSKNPIVKALVHQTPADDGVWEDVQFFTSCEPSPAARGEKQGDWLVVLDRQPKDFYTHIPWQRRILIQNEPPEIRVYLPQFTDQFAFVLGWIEKRRNKGHAIFSNSILPWMYGVDFKAPDKESLTWSQLREAGSKDRNNRVSVVCSTKDLTWCHTRRIRFLELLKARLGDRLCLYGAGFQTIPRKSTAIDSTTWHLALENNYAPHSWTEKIADPYIGRAFPLYAGDPTLGTYFPEKSFLRLDLTEPSAAAEAIERRLDNSLTQEQLEALETARDRLFYEHNLFPVLTKALKEASHKIPSTGFLKEPEYLAHPQKAFWRKQFPNLKTNLGPWRKRWIELREPA